MSRKRRNTSSPEASPSPSPRGRTALPALSYDSDDSQENDEKPQLNTEVGQTGAFPGLGPADGDELFYGPASDGIEYLRMVRSEARGVPSLLTAPRNTTNPASSEAAASATQDEHNGEEYNNGAGVGGGYWAEDTFIAARTTQNNSSKDQRTLPAAQVRYYESLLAQFHLLQTTLRCTPPLSVIRSLNAETQPISFPSNSEKAQLKWRRQVKERDPNIVQLACTDTESVLELMGLLEEMLRFGNGKGEEVEWDKMGAWLWASLGRCRERGEMGSEEVGVLRDLARAAVEGLGEREESDGMDGRAAERVEPDAESGGGESEEMKENEDNAVRSKEMILDMVITIVGEVYGQRDLLESRRVWQSSST